jgi:RNA polymerase sigma-B factor
MAEEKTNELFIRYRETGEVALRNQIAEKYLYIADILAKKFVGRGVEYDDLKQVASLALLRGIDRFDPSLGMQFSTFITPTITGEIKNYFRDKSRIVKVPRRLGEIGAQVRSFSNRYLSENGVKPSVREIAEGIGVSEEYVVRAMEIAGTVSLDGMRTTEEDGEQSMYGLIADSEDEFDRFETKEALKAAMVGMTDTEKQLVKYRFVDELSQSETANKLGVSQMFVSRLERKLLARLKENLQDSM